MRLIPPTGPVDCPVDTKLGTQPVQAPAPGQPKTALPISVYNTAPDPQPTTGATGDESNNSTLDTVTSDTPSWVSEYLIETGQQNAPYINTVENPPWLCKHIDDKDPSCPSPEYSDHYCDECSYWQENWKGVTFPGGMTQPKSGRGPERGVYGHNSFTNLCGMWCTPDFFSECNYFDRESQGIPLNVIEYSIGYASEILYKLSGRQYTGMCERLVYPGTDRSACGPSSKSINSDFSLAFGSCCDIGSCGSGCCGGAVNQIRLPRPINNVIEIVINGEVLPRSAYKISGDNKLIRVDGGKWPEYNDLTRSPFQQVKPTLVAPKAKSWLERWAADAGFPCTDRQDLKIKLNAPVWVNNFLQDNPDLVKALPTEQLWVRAWLEGNGYSLPADSTKCAEVINSGKTFNAAAASGCDSATINDVCNYIIGIQPNLPGTYKWKDDSAYNKVVNDLNKAGASCPSWAIRYYQGKCPPLSGQLAAAALAREIAKSICVERCIPTNTARIVAEGFDMRLINRFQSIYSNFPFGILEVDAFLFATNPSGLQRRGSVHRASGKSGIQIRNLR